MQPLAPVRFEHENTALAGFAVRPEEHGPHPAVIVFHSALGLRHMTEAKARDLAVMGYFAVAADMYGTDADTGRPEDAGRYYMDLLQNPERLRSRAAAWFDRVAAIPDVDSGRVAAIGYCFGGRCALELARSGADVKATVSYHGILSTHAPAQAGAIKAEVVAYCGMKDPYAPPAEVEALRQELTSAKARYQITEFADAAHGFTDIDAEKLGQEGIAYHPIADRVSWAGTTALLEVVLRN